MALLEDLTGSTLGLGVAGVAAVLLAPTVLPWMGRIARPLIKEAVKGGMVLYYSTTEGVSGLVSEATAEANATVASRGPSGPGPSDHSR